MYIHTYIGQYIYTDVPAGLNLEFLDVLVVVYPAYGPEVPVPTQLAPPTLEDLPRPVGVGAVLDDVIPLSVRVFRGPYQVHMVSHCMEGVCVSVSECV